MLKFWFTIDNEYGMSQLVYHGPEPKTLEDAWEIAQAKWRKIRADLPEDCGGTKTCGLCVLFFGYVPGRTTFCRGCPIAKAGYPGCKNTPYQDYLDADSDDERREAADAEIEFLEGIKTADEQARARKEAYLRAVSPTQED